MLAPMLPDRRSPSAAVALCLLLGVLAPWGTVAAERPATPGAGRWIVAVARAGGSAIGPRGALGPAPRSRAVPGDPAARRQVQRLLQVTGIRPSVVYRHAFDGFAATVSRAQLAILRRDPAVAVLIPDVATSVGGGTINAGVREVILDGPVVPTGIRRTRADAGPLSRIDGVDDVLDVDVAVVDTGIAPSRELRIAGGYDCSSDDPAAWRDREGHGTHVSGTIAARDDDRGVVGVAPGARLWRSRSSMTVAVGSCRSSCVAWTMCWACATRTRLPTPGRGRQPEHRAVAGRPGRSRLRSSLR